MAKFDVTLPFAGYLYVQVEAKDKEHAIEMAFEEVGDNISIRASGSVELGEFETLKHITRGNVCYAPRNDIEVEEIES